MPTGNDVLTNQWYYGNDVMTTDNGVILMTRHVAMAAIAMLMDYDDVIDTGNDA